MTARRNRFVIFNTVFLLLAFWPDATVNPGDQHFARIRDFRLEYGSVIHDCSIGYRTFGSPNADSSNVIIYPTWFGGTSEHIGRLIGPDKLIDPDGYYIIAVDALGNGVSSSPSNSKKQPGSKFPEITIRDMVHSQYILITEELGFSYLYAAIGGSMGSMQVFEWITTYPGFIDKAIPYVCSPRLSSHDLLLLHTRLYIIETGRESEWNDSQILKALNMLEAMVARTPEYRVRETPADRFPEYLKSFDSESPVQFGVDDRLTQIRAMIRHNIAEPYGNSMEMATSRIDAQLFIIVARQDHILTPQPALNVAKLTGADVMVLDNNCGHLAVGCEMTRVRKAIREFLTK